jgi:hypothetical protein
MRTARSGDPRRTVELQFVFFGPDSDQGPGNLLRRRPSFSLSQSDMLAPASRNVCPTKTGCSPSAKSRIPLWSKRPWHPGNTHGPLFSDVARVTCNIHAARATALRRAAESAAPRAPVGAPVHGQGRLPPGTETS